MRRAALLFALASSALACGGAASSQAPKSGGAASSQTLYTTVDEAERDLSRLEREVAAAAPSTGDDRREMQPRKGAPERPPSGAAPTTPAPAEPPSPPPPPPPKADGKPSDTPKSESAEERAVPTPTPCETACRALASMARAADAICRLAGDTDPRCTNARKRVEDSAARASACRCAQLHPLPTASQKQKP